MCKIVAIADDNITANVIDHKSEVTDKALVIVYQKAVDTYQVFRGKLPTLVPPTIEMSTLLETRVATGKVLIALALAAKLYPTPSNIVCLTQPKSLVADAVIKKGALTLVPMTGSISIIDGEPRPYTFTSRVGGIKFELKPWLNDDMTVPAWYCNTAIDKKNVNMKFDIVSIDINAGVEGEGGKHYKSSSNIDIPVIVNTRAVKVGEDLVLPAQPKETHKRRFDVI